VKLINFLVFGHSGFIGTALVKILNQNDNNRVFLSDFRFTESTTINEIREHLTKFPQQITIFNAIGHGLGRTSTSQSQLLISNTLWPIRLIEALDSFGMRSRTLIHLASSLEARGNIGESEYAESKDRATRELLERRSASQTPVVIVWLSSVYGPNQPRGRFVADLIDAIKSQTKFALAYPERRRRFIFVSDAVAILERIAMTVEIPKVSGTDFVISTAMAISLREAREIAFRRTTGSDYPFEQEEVTEFDAFASEPDDLHFGDRGATVLYGNTPLETGLMIQFLSQ